MHTHKTCGNCGKTIYGTREREADGYRTWWETHTCENKESK